MKTLGERIKIARETLGLSQVAFARLIGVTSQMVNQWEKEYNGKGPSRDNLFRVARTTNSSVDWLLYGGELPEKDAHGRFKFPAQRVGAIPMLSVSDAIARRQPAADAPRITAFFACGTNSYYFVLPNNSNAPDHPSGSVWIVDPDAPPLADSWVLASHKTPPEPIFGRLRYETTPAGQVTVVEPANTKWAHARSDLGPLDIIAVMTESVRAGG